MSAPSTRAVTVRTRGTILGREAAGDNDADADADADADMVACHDCDAVQTVRASSRGGERHACFRCGATLIQTSADEQHARTSELSLALLLAAVPLFVAAQWLPLMRLDGAGQRLAVTVAGGARALGEQGLWALATLVLLTTVIVPGTRLTALVCVLVWRRRARRPGTASAALRVLEALRPWNQLEILLVGVLVAFEKLAIDFHMAPGAGLPCLVAVLVLERVAQGSLDGGHLWRSTALAPPAATACTRRPRVA